MNNQYRIVQINNYVKSRRDYLKVKKAQRLSREIISKIQEEKKYNEVIAKEDDVNMCRICYDDEETEDNKLIRPCKCKGTQKWIHEKCLLEWLNMNLNNPEKRDYCDICKYKFRIRDSRPRDISDLEQSIIMRSFNLDISKNLIEQNFIKCSVRYLLLLVASFGFTGLDMYCNFFSVQILTIGTCHDDRCQILKNFHMIKDDNHSSMQGYMFFIYFAYVMKLLFTFYETYCIIYFFLRKRVIHPRFQEYYDSKTKKSYKMTVASNLIFYIFFYISLFSNTTFLIQFFTVSLLFNIFNFELFISSHNNIVKDIQLIIRNNNLNVRMINNFRDNNVDINLNILEYSTDTSSEADVGEKKDEEKIGTLYDSD